tara:strand:+ start:515 stop:766 length:252 start_codon:yes stop_codon:yes gene_type:complete
MKVKIMQRSVYHKYAEIEVDVPDNVDARDWLIDNEQDWVDTLDTKINISEFVFGNGMDTYDWTDKDEESEWMYMGEDGIGGHL